MKTTLIGAGAAAILVALFGALAPPDAAQAQAPAPAGIGGGSWLPLRPTQERHGADAGRINVIAFDPSAAATVYIGAPTGGLWRSLDNGATWQSLTDALPNLAVTDIAVDPLAPQTIYILSGDGDDAAMNPVAGLAPYSNGVIKSLDGGVTWQPTGLAWTTDQRVVAHRLAIHPTMPQILIAATDAGVLRTTDGFAHWTAAKTADGATLAAGPGDTFFDVVFNPADPSVVYASSQTHVYRSLDAGETWTQLGGGLPNVSTRSATRIRLAVSPAGPNTLYVLYGAPDGFSNGLYRSDDRGETFTLRSRSNQQPTATNQTPPFDLTRPNILFKFNAFGGQTGYTLAMAVSPTNIDRVHVGGLDTWRSDDGGRTWTQTSDWEAALGSLNYTHADIHHLVYRGATLFTASDGGVYQSDDGGTTWRGRNNITLGGGVAQIYSICTTPQNPNLLYYGSQDNGTWKLELDGTLTKILGGDGAVCQIDPKDANTVYVSYVNGDLLRSDDGGSHLTDITPGGAVPGSWVTPYVLGVTDPDSVYACYADVWVSNRGANWRNLSQGALGPSRQCIAIAIAPSDPSTIYVAKSDAYGNRLTPGSGNLPAFLGGGGVFRSSDGGTSWQSVTGTLPFSDAMIASLAVSPTDARRAWVTFYGFQPGERVYQTTDGGATWTNISDGLPSISVNVVAARNTPTNGIFVGTDNGVYYRDDSSNAWIPFSGGMPKVIVTTLAIDEARQRMFAGTYGRGVWQTALPAP